MDNPSKSSSKSSRQAAFFDPGQRPVTAEADTLFATYQFEACNTGCGLALTATCSQFARLFGLPERASFETWLGRIDASHRDQFSEFHRRQLNGGRCTPQRFHCRTASDDERWFETRVRADADGVAHGVAFEITRLNRMVESMRAELERFHDFSHHMHEVLWMVGSDGEPLYLSHSFERIWGCPRDVMLADRGLWTRMLHPDDRDSMDNIEAILGGESDAAEREYRIIRPDGAMRWVRDRAFAVRDAQGRIVRIAGICEDVTERKKLAAEREALDERVRQAQKLESLGILAGGIAHDFNNLLMGMLGHANLVLEMLPPESPALASVRQIEQTAEQAAELTNQMLAYSGKGRFVIDDLDLNLLVEEMGHLLATVLSKKTIVRYELQPALPAIHGDAAQVRQVVMNLITNASEALEGNQGTVTLASRAQTVDADYLSSCDLSQELPPGDYVVLEVSDTGKGMDAETRSRIFDPFFTTKFTGRGLGLAAVQGILRGHKGAIQVYSEPGRGTSFKLLFPAVSGTAATDRRSGQIAEAMKLSGTVLVIDDDSHAVTATTAMLEHVGLSVMQAGDGGEGVALYRDHAAVIDLVILDMTMPHMSGEETFRELRRIHPDVKVILTSGYNEVDAINRFAGKGLAGFIQKPYRLAALTAVVREALD